MLQKERAAERQPGLLPSCFLGDTSISLPKQEPLEAALYQNIPSVLRVRP